MQQSHAYNDTSLELTAKILDAKARKNLSFEDLVEGTGLGLAYVTAALLGQHRCRKRSERDRQETGPGRRFGSRLQIIRCAAACRVCRPTRPSTASTR
jgi:hypothetical protein